MAGLPSIPGCGSTGSLAGAYFMSARSMIVTGTVADWQEWTGLPMPGSGQYVVPRALAPVDVDYQRDLVRYTEPNVWVRHEVR